MNDFFKDNFNISKIHICLYVPEGSGTPYFKNRKNHGLVIQLSGIKKYIFSDGYCFNVKSGSVFYLPKFSDYEVESIETGDCIAVNFELFDETKTYKPFCRDYSLAESFEDDFNKILKNWDLRRPGYLNSCMANLYGIISKIQYDANKKYVHSKTKKLVFDSVEYIRKNISDCTLSIQGIADFLNISPEYYRKLFNSAYGISPKKYIIEERIKKAKALIVSEEFTICEISRICGYESESYFSREFKRVCGCTPSKYEKEL